MVLVPSGRTSKQSFAEREEARIREHALPLDHVKDPAEHHSYRVAVADATPSRH